MASTEDSGDRGSQAAQSREQGIESARKTASWLLHCARRCGSNHWRPDTHGDKTGAGKRRPRPPAAQVTIVRRKCVPPSRMTHVTASSKPIWLCFEIPLAHPIPKTGLTLRFMVKLSPRKPLGPPRQPPRPAHVFSVCIARNTRLDLNRSRRFDNFSCFYFQ